MNRITVAMALYRPNMKWLAEELESIERQTYRDFFVIVWNDCPEDTYNYEKFFKEHMPSIPFRIVCGGENLGTTGAFEKLTEITRTPYIAYCDQDDIWFEDKLEILLRTIETEHANLVYGDVIVIDANSKMTASCFSEVMPRHVFYSGKDVLPHLLGKNFVAGCTTIMKTETAQAALPFPKCVFHDWWLAVYAAATGKIVMAPKPLVKYRIYGGNQSAVLSGIEDKGSYYQKRIISQYEFLRAVAERLKGNVEVEAALKWNLARKEYFLHPTLQSLKVMWAQRNKEPWKIYFETVLPFMPNVLLRWIIREVKAGRL